MHDADEAGEDEVGEDNDDDEADDDGDDEWVQRMALQVTTVH